MGEDKICHKDKTLVGATAERPSTHTLFLLTSHKPVQSMSATGVSTLALAALAALLAAESSTAVLVDRRNANGLCGLINAHNPKERHWSRFFTGGKSNCAKFLNYGCYCGAGGADPAVATPVDSLDACCKAHDICYDDMNEGCEAVIGAYIRHGFSYECKEEDATTNWSNMCKCTDSDQAGCHYKKCHCDLVFARCLREQRDKGVTWNDKYHWPSSVFSSGFDYKTDPKCQH